MTKGGHKKINGVRHRMGRLRPFHKSMTGHLRRRAVPTEMYPTVQEAFEAARKKKG